MALQLPSKLKIGEVQRFVTRATQLEKFRPIVTYWCEYYILQYVLNRNLHTSDAECQTYALQLMDKLEQYKSENAANDAIVDDVAAKAYIENFALDTFARADDAQRANKVTKQTADTFMAAATFLDLLSIWGELDREVAAKSKFAKFHATRILKAFKAGEDPNASNPVLEEPPAPAEDVLDAELKDLEQQQNGAGGGVYRPPTVESAEHSGVPSRPESAMQGQPSAPPPLPQQTPIDFATQPSAPPPNEHEVSPIEPPDTAPMQDPVARQNSIGGGYFPTVSQQPPDVDMLDLSQPPGQTPSHPPMQPPSQSSMQSPPLPQVQTPQSPMNPQDFYNTNAQPPVVPSPGAVGLSSPNRPHRPPPDEMTARPPSVSYAQPLPAPQLFPQPPPQQSVAPPPSLRSGPPPGGYRTDDESTIAAQKHARWAISALNFEDVNTAVKELRIALQSLGAT